MASRVPHNRIFNDPKTCTVCNRTYDRRIGVPQTQWRLSKFCSVQCKNESQHETSKNRRHSIVTRLKMRASAKKGSESRLWKGGTNPEHKSIRGSVEYKIWRRAVFERDKFTCVFCRKIGGYLQADHIKPFAYFPELRFAIDNGRTLCAPCHKLTDTYGARVRKIYE